jgi:putative ABC transport system permease protein
MWRGFSATYRRECRKSEKFMDVLLQDLRWAARSLGRNPGFAAIAVICLALGIGANTAIFSMVHGILLRKLPFTDAERVVSLQSTNERRAITEGNLTYADLEDFRSAGVFSELGGFSGRSFTLTGGEEAERVEGSSITPNLFLLLGVEPKLGRNFTADDAAAPGFESVVLLSETLWRRRFAADPDIVGRSIHVNGRELTVVGVMPPRFRFPETDELWVPLGSRDAQDRSARWIWGVGRLAPGIALESARQRLHAVAQRNEQRHPDSHRGWGVRLVAFRDAFIDAPGQRLMHVMLGAVGFVLLIACANVANLMLARSADREVEIAVRAALGASRGRVARQLLTESVLVAVAAALLGVLIAAWWLEATWRLIPEEMAYWIEIGMNGPVLAYTVGLAILTGLMFGSIPAVTAARTDLHEHLKQGGRGALETRARQRFRSLLVSGEIALSLMLLVAAVLMVQSFLRLQRAHPGFDDARILSMRLTLPGGRYDPTETRATFFQGAVDRISGLHGVAGAVITSSIPADDGGPSVPVLAEGTGTAEDETMIATTYASTTGLFNALGVALHAGRDFTRGEIMDTAAVVAIVGRTFAATLWPGADPIGRRFRVGPDRWYTVIGVAPDLQYQEFGEETLQDRLQVHIPYSRAGYRGMDLLVRAVGDPAALTRPVRAVLSTLDPLVAPYDVLTMTERRRYTNWPQRLFGVQFAIFGGVAFMLALAGVYGVMSYTVARRRRELGIRIALGARAANVLGLVLRRGLRIALTGVVVGLAGALALTRLLGGVLWGVSVTDPFTFLVAPLLLAGAALLASYVPARRAARVDPMVTLRSE